MEGDVEEPIIRIDILCCDYSASLNAAVLLQRQRRVDVAPMLAHPVDEVCVIAWDAAPAGKQHYREEHG
jgi:hypothetical protein